MFSTKIAIQENLVIPDSHQESFDFSKYTLFEVPKEILDDLESMSIRADNNETEAFLCTKNKTYSIRRAETSNLLMLHSKGQETGFELSKAYKSEHTEAPTDHFDIVDIGSIYYEVRPTKPSPDTLKRLLQENVYDGTNKQFQTTFDYLRSNVSMSDQEILDALEELHCINIDDKWVMVDDQLMRRVLQLIMLSCVEDDIAIESVPASQILVLLQDHHVHEAIIIGCLSQFKVSETNGVFRLSKEKITTAYGHEILSKLTNAMDLQSFMLEWDSQLPDGFTTDLNLLAGLYLIEESMGNKEIVYFPKSILPFDPKQRFQDLFKIRRKWLKQDMLPFVTDLAPNQRALDAVLLTHCRLSTEGPRGNQTIYLTPRHTNF
ncbi:sister chromatid cohesion protein Dcc1 [Gorgonomyces haynaldii]|nr:sister chromatid cohesion protein Dcc1 [Gorgonomyces haynaldii]